MIKMRLIDCPLNYLDVLGIVDALEIKSFDWRDEGARDTYTESHSKRYAYLLNTIGKLLEETWGKTKSLEVLDIGPGFQTRLLKAVFPAFEIDTLGFADPPRAGFLRDIVRHHYEFDLNDFQFDNCNPDLDRYDIILFCEVIEHLYTMPEKVLRHLKPHLKPNGLLIIQTPNAVSWRHRLKMLIGRNPFARITTYRMGHYREYTAKELCEIAALTGFQVRSLRLENYFGLHKRPITALIDNLLWPVAGLRSGITIALTPSP